MNIRDDTLPINDTHQIYMVSSFGTNQPTGLNEVSDENLQSVEMQLNKIDDINNEQR